MIDLISTLVSWLDEGAHVVCATIAASEGSTPRSAGSKMILRAGGDTRGSVGGGAVEAGVVQAAAQVLGHGMPTLLPYDLSGELAAGAGMVCGGKVTIFLERLQPGPDAVLYRELLARTSQGERCLLVTSVQGRGCALLTPGGSRSGAELPAEVLKHVLALKNLRAPALFTVGENDWLAESWAGPSRLFIAGAGHVARYTARVAAMAGFQVTVMDDRPEFASKSRFPESHSVQVKDLRSCLEGLAIGPDSSIVILTRGHLCDAEVLEQSLATRAGYIGMIGSRRKRDAVYEKLRGKGFTGADFARVRCPIGLAIGAQTPEEIAVSITAELIAARAARASGETAPPP